MFAGVVCGFVSLCLGDLFCCGLLLMILVICWLAIGCCFGFIVILTCDVCVWDFVGMA